MIEEKEEESSIKTKKSQISTPYTSDTERREIEKMKRKEIKRLAKESEKKQKLFDDEM